MKSNIHLIIMISKKKQYIADKSFFRSSQSDYFE